MTSRHQGHHEEVEITGAHGSRRGAYGEDILVGDCFPTKYWMTSPLTETCAIGDTGTRHARRPTAAVAIPPRCPVVILANDSIAFANRT